MKANKILATIVALSTIAYNMASMATMSADAAKIPGIDSEFEYGLTATAVSDSQIKVTFYTVNNPGMAYFDTYFLYENDKYDMVDFSFDLDSECDDTVLHGSALNAELGLFFIGLGFGNNEYLSCDCTHDFEFSYYLQAKDGDVTDEDLSTFSIAISKYTSLTENIDYNRSNAEASPDDFLVITPAQSFIYKYMLGDADGSESLTMSDATAIQSLAACAVATDVTPSINILNDKISNNAVDTTASGAEVAWGSRFGTFMRNVNNVSFPCVEAADINKDNRVTKEDAQLVLDKYAEISSNVSAEDILEIVDKTIYCNF